MPSKFKTRRKSKFIVTEENFQNTYTTDYTRFYGITVTFDQTTRKYCEFKNRLMYILFHNTMVVLASKFKVKGLSNMHIYGDLHKDGTIHFHGTLIIDKSLDTFRVIKKISNYCNRYYGFSLITTIADEPHWSNYISKRDEELKWTYIWYKWIHLPLHSPLYEDIKQFKRQLTHLSKFRLAEHPRPIVIYRNTQTKYLKCDCDKQS